MAQIKSGRLTTADNTSQSASLELGTDTLVGLYCPSAIDADSLSVQASDDNIQFADIRNTNGPLVVPAVADSYVALDPSQMLGARFVRIAHQDSVGSPVNETAERVFTLMFRSFE